ncbi:nitrate reductase molybdenum cofactor assembly chaperone [Cellulomonas xiejunii]|uniref:nitrate reductase molybdenum cofactor assembly chaperone n=1 Tax=Cellulomonas xiejunii TaxID=2968083 RepID=UPI001D0E6F5F|nr:nitrate reductase molybdenum cofactor assembly chaperone [Cellulomonas xiejunii]MCC2313725.1 nitrate reductase molybdenum cofactor assembly chaperone [Cellulomonas xiejunii]
MRRLARRTAAHHAATRQTALVHRVAALLLDYPGADLLAMLPDLRAAVATLPPHLGTPLAQVVDHLETQPATALAAQYVETFDLARRRSPYLSYYSYGDTRKRGVALVEYKQAYRAAGFELAADELPDHVAVVLEFASTGDVATQESGLRLLLAHRAGLELLRLALLDAGSPWAGALVAVCATLPPLDGDDREAVARLAAQGPPGEEVGLEPFAPPSFATDPGARR